MGLFEWWADLNPWLRRGVAALFLLVSTVLWAAGYFWPYGWVVGVILLAFGGPSKSEKNGYRF